MATHLPKASNDIAVREMIHSQPSPNSHTIPTHMCVSPMHVENVRFTTSIQQLYNNPSHEGGSHILGPTLM
jgi:hypothetical protein